MIKVLYWIRAILLLPLKLIILISVVICIGTIIVTFIGLISVGLLLTIQVLFYKGIILISNNFMLRSK